MLVRWDLTVLQAYNDRPGDRTMARGSRSAFNQPGTHWILKGLGSLVISHRHTNKELKDYKK